MRVVVCESFGPVEQLVIEERPAAQLGPGQVRVAVRAAGVNFVDGLIVQGRYQIKPPLPYLPGSEFAGVVAETAADVDTVTVGERVLGSAAGAWADEIVVDARRLVPVPERLSDGQAATFYQSYLTGWFALRERITVKPGETMLVLGAGSGLGLAAVDIGHALGMRVLAAASSREKRALAGEKGAEALIDSSTEDVKERAKQLGGGGVDVVYDPVGGELGETCLRALREDGRFLVVGFASGRIPQLPANQVLLRNRRVVGVDWGAWVGRNPARHAELVGEVLAELEAGSLRPVEPVRYPLTEVARALADFAGRRVTGRVALVP